MRRIGWFEHESFLQHNTGPGHPERPARLTVIREHLERTGVLDRLVRHTPEPATRDVLSLVHPPRYIDAIHAACQAGLHALDPDTIVSPGSWDAALRAVGAVTSAVDLVVSGALDSAFCAVRPPGHHAPASQAMGFCLFNNVAIGARYARQRHGVERVLIVDWDVHHGNGTQDIFEADGHVFYFSVHQSSWYPGTGHAEERGEGPGQGCVLNVPVPAGSDDRHALAAIEGQLAPAMRAFRPQMVFISAGFDAHRDDPLAGLRYTEAGYARLTHAVRALAREAGHDRIVSVLEGGYDLRALALSAAAHVEALLEDGPAA